MVREFTPLKTTMSSFDTAEKNMYQQFMLAGYDEVVAEAVAHGFTRFILGYVTEQELICSLIDAGASDELAHAIAKSFRNVVSQTNDDSSSDNPQHRRSLRGDEEAAIAR